MKRFIISFALFLPLLLQAQTQLTLQSAIDTALRNNLDITDRQKLCADRQSEQQLWQCGRTALYQCQRG